MSRYGNDSRYITSKEKLEILKTGDRRNILEDYKFGEIVHEYTSEPFDKYDERKVNGSSITYKLNLFSHFMINEKMNDELFNTVRESIPHINYDTKAGYYYYFGMGSTSDYRRAPDILAKVIIRPNQFTYNNSAYIKQLFEDENFYKSKKDSELFEFKDSEPAKKNKTERNIDFGRYAFMSGNKLALNHIYEELKNNKKTYQEFVFDELNANQFALAIQHYKSKNIHWPNKNDEQIKPVDNIFYNLDFIMLFASNPLALSKNQKNLLEFVLKDKKLIEKLEANAGKNNIYSKDSFTQKGSRDPFVVAVNKKNADFINVLLASNYKANPNEIALLNTSDISNRITNLNKIEVDNIDVITQKFLKEISANYTKSSSLDYVYDLSEQDINSLQKNYDQFKHSFSLYKIINEDKNPVTNIYDGKHGTIVDTLVLKEPYALPALYAKGFNHINPKVEDVVFKNLLIVKSSRNTSFNSMNDSIKFIDDYLNRKHDGGRNAITNVLFSLDSTNKDISPALDFYVTRKIEEVGYDEDDKAYFASSSLAFFNTLSADEKNEFFGSEISKMVKEFTNRYLDTLVNKFNPAPMPHEHRQQLINELAKLNIAHDQVLDIIKEVASRTIKENSDKYNELAVSVEKAHLKLLTDDIGDIKPKQQKRL